MEFVVISLKGYSYQPVPPLRDLFRESPAQAVDRMDFHEQFLADGNLDPQHTPPIGYAHVTTISEFRSLFSQAFDEIIFVGTESFTTAWQHTPADLSGEAREAWLYLIEETGKTPEGMARSDHFLFIGKRR